MLLLIEDHSIIYKRLSRLAFTLLSIPASSASSERIFSETGRTLETRRQLLSPDSSDALVSLRHCICSSDRYFYRVFI